MASISFLCMVEVIHHKPFTKKEIKAVKKNSTVLGNLLSHFPRSEFELAVREYSGDRRVRTFGCYDLAKTLIYAQVTGAFSTREIQSALAANAKKLYHLGMRPVTRSTLCDAMGNRDHRIFQESFEALVKKAHLIAGSTKRRFRNPLKIIDASTIELCLARFDWAQFRTTKGAVKLHVALDGDTMVPTQVRLTAGNIAEVTELSHFDLAKGDIVVMDRGYIDYKRLFRIELGGATFVTRMKEGCRYQPLSLKVFPKGSAVQIDARIRLSSIRGSRNYPRDLREVVYHDTVHNRDYVFLTNNFDLSAQEIADVYKARWQVELFFKWIKQNLKIKTFWGTSRNAVYTQIWVALIVFMLIWINKALSGLSSAPQRILQILKTTILGTGSLSSLFFPPPPPDIPDPSQLLLGGFKY